MADHAKSVTVAFTHAILTKSNLTALEKGLKANKRVTVRRLPGVQHWFQTPAAELIRNADGKVDPVVSAAMLDAVRDWVLGLGRQ